MVVEGLKFSGYINILTKYLSVAEGKRDNED